MKKNTALVAGGGISLLICILHVGIIFSGPGAYLFFGAGEAMASLEKQGSWIPDAITAVVAIAFAVFAAYALSGAEIVRRLPLLRFCLAAITAVYLLRGMGLFADLFLIYQNSDYPIRSLMFSIVSLGTGLLYFFGVKKTHQGYVK